MPVERALRRRTAERDTLIGTARQFVAALDPALGVSAAVVFGSVARGDFNLWSDIDVLIVANNISGNALERLDFLGDWPARVHPILWTAAEWRAQVRRGNRITRDVIEAGVWLVGSAAALDRA